MNPRIKAFLIGSLTYAFSVNAMALACSSTSTWGSLGPPDVESFGQTFTSAGSYADCYSFSLEGTADGLGGVIEMNTLYNELNIDVTDVSLFSGDVLGGSTTGSLLGNGLTDSQFSFLGLEAGIYSLVISSQVLSDPGLLLLPVSYAGQITTVPGKQVPPTSAPEPATLGLFGLALTGLGLARRRRATH